MIIPEILAPAGSMEALYAAIHAGADAVYFGGKVLSARAYAGNFNKAEIKEATKLLHQHRAKAYLTLNTLIKNHELKLLGEIGDTLCQAGIDAVILQDMGAYLFFKKYFPELTLHASTQMTVHSIAGTQRLYNLGFERVVLSRELNLREVKQIMDAVPIEVETFVHGALCYCYSGQCQMSAAYGERSANRGKCAQPCRLPYQSERKSGYLLSLKDQMTLYHLPELVNAGIHSFKIEGRMKNPEYVYTTVSMYKKYRDLALQENNYIVDEADIQKMNEVFSRGKTSEGYYFVRKSANMISPEQPKTNKLTNAKTLASLSFVREMPKKKHKIAMKFYAEIHRPIQLIVEFMGEQVELSPICLTGAIVEVAKKKEIRVCDIEKPLKQTGDTNFVIHQLKILLSEGAFIPLSHVKELRRQALIEAEQTLKIWQNCSEETCDYLDNVNVQGKKMIDFLEEYSRKSYEIPEISILVRTSEQLKTALFSSVDRIYIEWSFLAVKKIKEIIEYWYKEVSIPDKKLFFAMPTILRHQEEKSFWNELEWLRVELKKWDIHLGVLTRTADYLERLNAKNISVILDHSMNIWNQLAYQFYIDQYEPLDICLNNELSYLSRSQIGKFELVVYGKLATMQTANCLANVNSQAKNCSSNPLCKTGALETLDYITDRKGSSLGYHRNCKSCSNTLFNSIPLFLADQDINYAHCIRFELLDEKPAEIKILMKMIQQIKAGQKIMENPFADFTRGHYNKGVE